MLPDFWLTSSATTEPSLPPLLTIVLSGARQGVQHDVDADLLVALGLVASLLDRFGAAEQGHAAAGQNAFFDRRTGGVQGVFDAGLLLLHVGFGLGADADHRHAAGQLGQPFLELFLVVFAFGLGDLVLDLLNPLVDVGPLAGAFDDRRVVLIDRDLLGAAQVLELRFSSWMPRSSLISVPPVSTAMSPSIALRRSPKPGAFTAQTLSTPRSLLTTSSVSASASTSSAMISSGLPLWADLFQDRHQVADGC